MEREDSDVVALVREKTAELAQAHRAAWQGLRDAKVAAVSLSPTPSADGTPHGDAESNGVPTGAEPSPERPAHLPPDPHTEPKAPLEPATLGQRGALRILLDNAKWSDERRAAHLREQFDCERIEDLSGVQAAEWLLELQRAAREEADQQRQHASRNGAGKR